MAQRWLAWLGVAGCVAGCGGRGAGWSAPAETPVRPGLEVLLAERMPLVAGRRVGLVANQGAVDAGGVHAVERLRAAGVALAALFSPEHGFRGTAAPGEAVAHAVDSATGLPIYSLYGPSVAPTDAMLDQVDLLLVDLPDVGARYFTYLSTTIAVMRAAAPRGLPVVVLDRPNPIGGAVQGNVLEPASASFVGPLAIPMRHGMTLGELARLANADLALGADLRVIPASGWQRAWALDRTGLPFVPPSPNLRSLESLFHYPGLCLFEGTALSVGRGSEAPFEQIGAPWLDTTAVLARLLARGDGGGGGGALAGVALSSASFTPRAPGDGKFADTVVAGLRLRVTDRGRYDPTRAALALLAAVQAVHPDQIGWRPAHFDRLAGTPLLRGALARGEMPDAIAAGWALDRERFLLRRRPFLLY